MDANMVQIGAPVVAKPSVPTPAPITAGKTESALPPPIKTTNEQQTAAKQQVPYNKEKSDEARYENMRQASELVKSDMFAVSDTRFAIYKDGSGQFVTRFTNLRDGSVTYFPEPQMMNRLGSSTVPPQTLVNIDV